MEIPLKLKWLGKETRELCDLLSPFHPMILVSPAPQLRTSDLPAGFIRLPHRVCRVWDLRRGDFASDPDASSQADVAVEVIELHDLAQSFAAINEFYFEGYLRNSALHHAPRVSNDYNLQSFYSNLYERRFIALVRAVRDNRTVGGLLLRHPKAIELNAYRARLRSSSIAIIDVLSPDPRSKYLKLLVRRACEWARDAGYHSLSSLPNSAVVIAENKVDDDSTLASENITVWQEEKAGLLYCDLRRCSYLSNDVYFYSFCGDEVYLNYVANVLPAYSRIVRLLKSTTDLKKRVYTRHAPVRSTLDAAGIECAFLVP